MLCWLSELLELKPQPQLKTLKTRVDQQVAAPQAEPKEILEIVASLPSATVRTPRTLSGLHESLGFDSGASYGFQ